MEEEEYDYESLGGNTSMTQNALAGAMAGIAEHCAMYPVDSIKVSLVALQTTSSMLEHVFISSRYRLECKLYTAPQKRQ
jgi:solute carrier family 25 iron transporter 28/37